MVRDTKGTAGDTEVVLGEDWVSPQSHVDAELREGRRRRGLLSINRSPLARKIITFNILGLVVLVGGVLYLNPFRESLLFQRERSLVASAQIVADVFEVGAAGTASAPDTPGLSAERVARIIPQIGLYDSGSLMVFDASGVLLGSNASNPQMQAPDAIGLERDYGSTIITDGLSRVWDLIAGLLSSGGEDGAAVYDGEARAREFLGDALAGNTRIASVNGANGSVTYFVTTPIVLQGEVIGAVAVESTGGLVDSLVRAEREQILQMFLIAILVSIGLSLVLASTIANPLADLAAAAEIGRDKNSRKVNPGRVRIPDLTGRPDEIGRLSKALRGMVAALYDRIDANEQFAADVAHEIKNPLASLRSAVGTLRLATKEEQRNRLLDVVDHDVRRLDRLVSDISNASRLDSELVKEEEEPFDLLKMLRNLGEYLGNEAHQKGVDFISDLPSDKIVINGLEARLAQVFVNLISNATSFCEEGDAIRVWARQRDNRVLVVVEDTGPGIPEEALTKIFNRFYSQRPENQFGNNSGLGLAISKQIVEAHGGVIWAENIRPTDADITSEPLGARFVVGLPV
ncbi:sensor histidine kinase [Sinisalibacter aestuarii]|uniref:histidine kinase n=1 Tax=Sinisalibacter aestuarii TaxID=2949426 RepID=A0ABQ5LXZ0_9RHOB|nr:sensor histidine kinase [Sinisalibacter aestuarii]